MAGIIWVIQILHYPLFAEIKLQTFGAYHQKHSKVMGFLVGPAMIFELAAAIFFIFQQFNFITFFNLSIVIGIWGLTFFVSVRYHGQLARAFDLSVVHKLILTNWPRTFLWTLKLIVASQFALNAYRRGG